MILSPARTTGLEKTRKEQTFADECYELFLTFEAVQPPWCEELSD